MTDTHMPSFIDVLVLLVQNPTRNLPTHQIKTSWSWAQNTNAVVANVVYILFTSSSFGGVGQYEIMIWLANYNAGPISYNYSASGAPIAIGVVTIGARTWSVYYGSDGTNLVYSFLPPANTVITSFSGDLKPYLTVRDISPFVHIYSVPYNC